MGYDNPRVKLEDTTMDVIMKMSDGNPGAINVMMCMLKDGGIIDPADVMGGFGSILFMDTLDIYGSKIWILFNDLCGRNLSKTIALLRAVQLGFMRESELHTAIDANSIGESRLAGLVAQVTAHLPDFKLTETV